MRIVEGVLDFHVVQWYFVLVIFTLRVTGVSLGYATLSLVIKRLLVLEFYLVIILGLLGGEFCLVFNLYGVLLLFSVGWGPKHALGSFVLLPMDVFYEIFQFVVGFTLVLKFHVLFFKLFVDGGVSIILSRPYEKSFEEIL